MLEKWPGRLLVGGFAVLMSGCSLGGSPFEGTWLFMIDIEAADLGGSCANEDPTFEEEGIWYQWVDIHSPGQDRLVVLMETSLTGTSEGKTFTVGSEESIEYTGYYLEETMELSGTLSGGILSGQITKSQETATGNKVSTSEFDCEIVWDYTAERSISHTEHFTEAE